MMDNSPPPATAEPTPSLPPGYSLESVLSHSGPSWVVRAHRADAGPNSKRTQLVLRLVSAEGSGEPDSELSVLATVRHPGIAPLADHGPLPGGGHFVARAWVEGSDLRQWAETHTGEECGAVVARLTPALEHLHRQGYVHADLKPENVVVLKDDRPILVDFGLARATRAARSEGLDPEGHSEPQGISGTLFSVAPELLLGLAPSPSSDLFALGAMLHRLLARPNRSARDFYSAFPRSSFLDAMGTDPEELPPWSRDLIAQLTARAPHRRPKSAARVGRMLADRLGLHLEFEPAEEAPEWTAITGREAWLAVLFTRLESGQSANLWLRTPPEEDPRPLARHLRIHAALRGRRSRDVDLTAELGSLPDALALDRWATQSIDGNSSERFILVNGLDPWRCRGLEALTRAADMSARKGSPAPGLVVISPLAPPLESWEEVPVPPVELDSARHFIAQQFPGEEVERRESFAQQVVTACGGSATRVNLILAHAARRGWLHFDDGAFRLRRGELPDLTGLVPRESDRGELEGMPRAERILLDAIDICGDDVSPDRAIRLATACEVDGTAAFLALSERGWLRTDRDGSGTRVHRCRTWSGPLSTLQDVRHMHSFCAETKRTSARDEGTRLVHAYCAEQDEQALEPLLLHLAGLRYSGHAEVALALCDQLDRQATPLGIEPRVAAPETLVERARCWASIGRTDQAEECLTRLAASRSPRIAAGMELVRAKVEALRHQTEPALAAYGRAAELHAGARNDAVVGRIELLHSLGRDREVIDAVDELAPREREAAGELTTRWRIYLESLASMSRHRQGVGEVAYQEMRALAAEAEQVEDPGLAAALSINLSLMERANGSLLRARTELEKAIELYDRAGLVSGLAHARGELGAVLRLMGELVQAEDYLSRGMETRYRLGDHSGAATLRGMLGLLYFERGHARSAIETLEASAEDMTGAQKQRFAPLLSAMAIEMRARIGDDSRLSSLPDATSDSDPRTLSSKARIAWKQGRLEEARSLFERAAQLADSLHAHRMAREARSSLARMDGTPGEPDALGAGKERTEEGILGLDQRLMKLLAPTEFRLEAAVALAGELERRGLDDRAARVLFALGARAGDADQGREFMEHAEALLTLCAAGLTTSETQALRMQLLNQPDPWPGDLAARSFAGEDAETSDDMLLLLEVNRQLTQEKNLGGLLSAIVDHALHVTDAERGFLVLEEHGELRFDTALDSCKGDIDQPEFEVSASVIRSALEEMNPILLSNAVDDPLVGHRTSVMSLELRSILCVPFEVSESLRGAIYLDHRLRKGAFGRRAERMCVLLADQAALAILQLRRLQEIQSLNRELERRVIDREADLSSARRALEKAGAVEPMAELLGNSDAMQAVRKLLARVGPSDLPILITGESGTGKELAARALHGLSTRRSGRFVSESCAALPASLIESELFGFRRGAFTGADRDHIGLIEQADGGTLFLDEIGEMPLELQAKLLRTLETGEIRRIGENTPRAVNFRLVSATNRQLEDEINEDRFRADLFYRIDGLRVVMPPLAERKQDIPLLTAHFLEQECGPNSGRKLSRKVLSALAQRPWPGNVRELKNEVGRLCVLGDGDIDDPALISTPAATQRTSPSPGVIPMAELERRAIEEALQVTHGDKRRAAELLGISRAKIYQRLKEWQ